MLLETVEEYDKEVEEDDDNSKEKELEDKLPKEEE